MCLVLLVLDIRLNTLTFKVLTTSKTQFYMWIIDIVATTTAYTCLNTKEKNSLLLMLTICSLILHT